MLKVIDNVFKGFKFEELGVGVIFKRYDEYYIKIMQVSHDNFEYNAVNLDGGELVYISNHEHAFPFDCELIVL